MVLMNQDDVRTNRYTQACMNADTPKCHCDDYVSVTASELTKTKKTAIISIGYI